MLVYPSAIDLSSRTLRHLSGLLAGHRRRIDSRWRRLTCGRQALLVLAHLCYGDTYGRLAAGFRVGVATVYRYIPEAVDLLAALAPTLEQAVTAVRKKAYAILDGTVLPIDRIAADQPYYSGKKKHHGMNVQVLADPAGRLIWAPDALPGAVHDLTPARTHGIPAALDTDDIKCWADKACQGSCPAVRVPFRGKGCVDGFGVTTAITPRSAASANAPWPPSSAERLCGNSAATPPGSQPSSVPSSPSNSLPDQDGKGSISRSWRIFKNLPRPARTKSSVISAPAAVPSPARRAARGAARSPAPTAPAASPRCPGSLSCYGCPLPPTGDRGSRGGLAPRPRRRSTRTPRTRTSASGTRDART